MGCSGQHWPNGSLRRRLAFSNLHAQCQVLTAAPCQVFCLCYIYEVMLEETDGNGKNYNVHDKEGGRQIHRWETASGFRPGARKQRDDRDRSAEGERGPERSSAPSLVPKKKPAPRTPKAGMSQKTSGLWLMNA